jgi:hypothetical protein
LLNGQIVQVVEPAAEYKPVPHTTGLIMPDIGQLHPAGQILQPFAL